VLPIAVVLGLPPAALLGSEPMLVLPIAVALGLPPLALLGSEPMLVLPIAVALGLPPLALLGSEPMLVLPAVVVVAEPAVLLATCVGDASVPPQPVGTHSRATRERQIDGNLNCFLIPTLVSTATVWGGSLGPMLDRSRRAVTQAPTKPPAGAWLARTRGGRCSRMPKPALWAFHLVAAAVPQCAGSNGATRRD
jgi:hypothetical protein